MSDLEGDSHTPPGKRSSTVPKYNTRFAGTKVPNTKFNQSGKVVKTSKKSRKNRSNSRDTLNTSKEDNSNFLNTSTQSIMSQDSVDPMASTPIDFSTLTDTVLANDDDKSISGSNMQENQKSNVSVLIDEQNQKSSIGDVREKRNGTSGVASDVLTKMSNLPDLYDYEDKDLYQKFSRLSMYEQNKGIIELLDYLKVNQV